MSAIPTIGGERVHEIYSADASLPGSWDAGQAPHMKPACEVGETANRADCARRAAGARGAGRRCIRRPWRSTVALCALAATACAAPPPPSTPPPVLAAPPPVTASAAPAPAPSQPPTIELHPVRVDIASLPAPEVRWSVPVGRTAFGAFAHGIVATLPGEAGAELVDADTGKVRWERKAARGERWRGLDAVTEDLSPFLFAESVDHHGHHWLVRLDYMTGKLVGHRKIDPAVEIERGVHGGLALRDRDRCEITIVDVVTGKTLGAPIRGAQKKLRDFKGRPAPECTTTVALQDIAHGTATVSVLRDDGVHLLEVTAAGVQRDRALGGQVVDQLEPRLYAALPVTASSGGELVRVEDDEAFGVHAFHWPIPARACSEPVRVRSSYPDRALVQACQHVALLDTTSGATRWMAEAKGLAVLDNETATSVTVGSQRLVERFSATGTSLGVLLLPPGTRTIWPSDGGLFVATDGAVASVDRALHVRWQYSAHFDRIRIFDGRVVLGSGDRDLLVQPQTGKLAVSGRSLGRAAADRSLWIDHMAGAIHALVIP